LPTVLLFKDGQVVEQFLGVKPESEIRSLLDPFLSNQESNQESKDETSDNLQKAVELIQAGDSLSAIEFLKNEASIDGKLILIKVLLAEGKIDEAFDFFNSLSAEDKQDQQSLFIKFTLDLIKLGQESNSPDLQEAVSHIVSVHPEQGVEKLLLLLKGSDDDGSKTIKKALLIAFNLFEDPKVVSQLRRKMAAIIF
jgi:putative thioredoxin